MDVERHPDFVDELEALVSSVAGFHDIMHELDDVRVILNNDAKGLNYVDTNDLLVMQAALLSCANRHDNVSLTEDNFSNLGYAQIAMHCAESGDEEFGQNCLLSSQGRKTALTLIEHINAVYASKGIPVNFAKVLASCSVCPLELLCRLHAGGVMCIEDYIALNVQNPQVIADLSRNLFAACQHLDKNESSAFTFSVFLSAVVSSAYSTSDHSDASSLRKVCGTMLETLLQRLLKANEEGQPIICGDLLGPVLQSPLVHQTAVLSYVQEILSCVLAYNPVYKVTQAMSSHHNWTYKKCSLWLLGIFQKSMQVLNVEQATTILCKALNSKEVNWYMLLTALSVYVTTYQDCRLLIGLIEKLLKGAFECLDTENLVSAFLLARHASQEAPQIFPPYSSWFEKYFGFSDTTYASSSRTFAFLVKFLSEMVPFEQPKYLKAHLQKPAHASPKCRVIYHDYVALAKTRLQDFEVADEKNAFSDDVEQLAQVRGFVQKCIEDFSAKGKIPRAVIEASIFKKPYFTGQFLPVLLNPENFLEQREVVCSLVQGLLQHGKISQERYDRFVNDCNSKETDDTTCDVEMNNEVPLFEHLLTQLRSGRMQNKDCEIIILRMIEEVRKNEREGQHEALNAEEELPYSNGVFELLHFAAEACSHQPLQPWIQCLLLAMGSSLSTVHLLAVFLRRQLTTTEAMDKQGAKIFSQFLLSVPVMWEDKPLKISFAGTTYTSMHEAVFSWLPLATLQERRQFLQLSAVYLAAAARQAPCNTVPLCVPEVLLKKFKFVAQRDECTLDEFDSDAWKQCNESTIKDWLQSTKLSVQEWVNFESKISDGVNAAITPVMRQDLLQFLADADSTRELCATLLRVLVCHGPRLPNYAPLHILLQSLLLNPPSSFSAKAVPFATETLIQLETEIGGCPVDAVERAINFFRIYCHLPPYCLLLNRTDDCPSSESVKLFITVINRNLRQILCSQQDMPILTLHLFKGLLQSNLPKAHASTILEQCPVLAACLICHWKSIFPVLDLELVKCDELGNLLTGVKKLFTLVTEFLAGSEESGRKLSKISKTWLPAFVLACSISSDQVMPLHYKSLKPTVQAMALKFLFVLYQRKDSKSKESLKMCMSRFLQENPGLCTFLEPSSFDSALMNKLVSALDFFLLLISCFKFVVDHLEQQKVKMTCCINTAILLMIHIDTIDRDMLSDGRAPAEVQAEGMCSPISTSAKLYSLIKNMPPAVRKSLPKTTLAMCPTVFRQAIEHL